MRYELWEDLRSTFQAEGTLGTDDSSGRSSGKGVSKGNMSDTGGEADRAATLDFVGHHPDG